MSVEKISWNETSNESDANCSVRGAPADFSTAPSTLAADTPPSLSAAAASAAFSAVDAPSTFSAGAVPPTPTVTTAPSATTPPSATTAPSTPPLAESLRCHERRFEMARWLIATPFGLPVEPDV